jgi:hypothetical protein
MTITEQQFYYYTLYYPFPSETDLSYPAFLLSATASGLSYIPVLRIRIQHFRMNTNPYSDPDPGFGKPKIGEKNYS